MNEERATDELAAPRTDRAPWVAIGLAGLAAAALRFAFALGWPDMARPDEVYQNLEPAYRLWTGWGVVTWEWRDGIRSWLFPGFLSGLMRLTDLFGWPHAWAQPVVWAALSLLSGVMVGVATLVGWRRRGPMGAVLCGVLTAAWPDLVYYGPKPLGEVQAGQLLAIAAGLVVLAPGRRPVVVGLLLGLAFDLRFQLAPACAVVAAWGARRRWAALLGAALVPVLGSAVLDWVSWGTPLQSIWKNVWVNLGEGRAARYGTEPPGWYGVALVREMGGALVPLGFGAWRGVRVAPVLAAVALVVVLSHSLIAHKEYSFIYAALPPLMMLAGLGLATTVASLRTLRQPLSRPGLVAAAAVTCLLTAAAVGLAQATERGGALPHGLASAWRVAAGRADLCGLGLLGDPAPWQFTPGYSGLRREVPIVLVTGREALPKFERGFNYLVAQGLDAPYLSGWDQLSCASGWCVFHQARTCAPVPDDEINASLARRGL